MKSTSNTSLKTKVAYGFFWKILERGGAQGVQFIISVILARLLLPKDFGTIALLAVFIMIADVFVQSGFGAALIQKKEVNDEDYSSVFYLSLIISFIVYVLLFIAAPLIGQFYSDSLLIPILRVMSLSLFMGAFNSVQYAVLSREMKFKKSFFVGLGGVFVSGIVGIVMAYCGYGVWSLVFSQLSGQLTSTIILWFTVRWRPSLIFSFSRIKMLFSFGSKLLVSALISTVFDNLYTLVIGKMYSPTIVGYYNKGQNIPLMIISNINGTISSVMFPALSTVQDDVKYFKELFQKMIVSSSFLVFPLMFGVIAVARPLVIILFTEKWLPSVPFLQLACFTYMFLPINLGNLQALNALGRSDLYLKLEIIKKILLLIVLVASMPFGIYAMIGSSAMLFCLCIVINTWPIGKILNYSTQEQIKDILPPFMLSIIMCIIVLFVGTLQINIYVLLGLQIVLGVFIYVGLAWILKLDSFTYLLISSFSFLGRGKK